MAALKAGGYEYILYIFIGQLLNKKDSHNVEQHKKNYKRQL